ncbi:MAG: efflux RND transporter periplasmic adaptor subunit [Planctomycetota bacterium]|jgi:RND family efflux transporter MFP subunit
MQNPDLSGLAHVPSETADTAQQRVPMPRKNWRSRILLPAVILATMIALVGFAARDTLMRTTPVNVVPVVVKNGHASQAEDTVLVQAPGWVEADPYPIAVSTLADGVVSEVLVLEGDIVKKDQVVARLVDDDARIMLKQHEAMLARSVAALEVARAKLNEAQANWQHPVELTRKLHTARAALQEKNAELARWPHELAREEARATYLRSEFERVEPLMKRGSASDIEIVRARQNLEAQLAEVEVIRKRELILKAQVLGLEAEVTAATRDLELRIADTRALEESQAAFDLAQASVASAQARRDDAALRLKRMEVRSPAHGVVMTRLVEPGSKLMLQMDDPHSAHVVRLYDPRKLQVRVDIPLVDAAKVGLAQPAEVIVDVLPDRVYRGRVSRIVHEADVQKNTLQVKVAIEDPSPELKPEMLARARFVGTSVSTSGSGKTGSAVQPVFVPRASISKNTEGTFVWLADQVTSTARLQPVVIGTAVIDDWVAIHEGLRVGDRVIVGAPKTLVHDQRIRLVEN